MTAYYNENDAGAAAWLRELISDDQIAPGDVDERSITEVQPSDLRGYSQCHFFAGIGGWSYALRLAGVADDEPIWTGSCPCQPLSGAGQRKGHADERHLWPAFHRLIAECRPPTVFGEQVASKDGREWLAGVRADLEALGYASGAADLCAAGVGAPHIRQRLYWMADAERGTTERHRHEMAGASEGLPRETRQQRLRPDARDGGYVERLANPDGRIASDSDLQRSGQHGQQPQDGSVGGMGDASGDGRERALVQSSVARETRQERPAPKRSSKVAWPSNTILCFDGKSRRVESGIFPLVDGLPRGVVPSGDPGSPDYANATAEARMMRLRGYGNAIVPELAAEFIRCAFEADPAALKQRGKT